ncbi:MAG: hypothetical protein Q4A25_00890 [Candidatus Saccharibacteria bacterium]|nr:hypothetical protein [Candidatus Saccharibacteria bacterium]
MKILRRRKKGDVKDGKRPDKTKNKAQNDEKIDIPKENLHQTIFGVRFPWEAVFFVTVGLLSEVVDAMFLNSTLETLGKDLNPIVATIISYIVGAGCFFSMAFVGFQLGNRRYYTRFGEKISYGFWAVAGVALVLAKLLAGLVGGGLDDVIAGNMSLGDLLASEAFISNAVIAFVQMVLYIGTGFMTRDSVRILTDNDLREYFLARRRYKKLLDELSDQRGDIVEDISKLKAYPKYAERLVESKRSVKKNVAQYNESARALIEARMAISVEPDLMEDMYDNAMAKEGRPTKK